MSVAEDLKTEVRTDKLWSASIALISCLCTLIGGYVAIGDKLVSASELEGKITKQVAAEKAVTDEKFRSVNEKLDELKKEQKEQGTTLNQIQRNQVESAGKMDMILRRLDRTHD